MCSLQNERLFDILVMKTASFAMKRVNSHGKCYKAEVSGKEGQIGRMPFLMEIWVTPTLHPRSPLENLETNSQCSVFSTFSKKLLLYFLLV